MSNPDDECMIQLSKFALSCLVLGACLVLLVGALKVRAHEGDPSWAQYTPDEQNWMGETQTTERSRERLRMEHGWSWKSCCNHGDRVKAKLRSIKTSNGYQDEWWYLKKGDEVRADEWVKIPNDVIHTEEDLENDSKMKNKMSPQMRVEGALFVYNGVVTCFWPPEDGD